MVEFVRISGMGFVGCLFIPSGSFISIQIAYSISIPIPIPFPSYFHTIHPFSFPSFSNKQTINQHLTPSNAAEHTQHASPSHPGTT